MVGSRQNLRQLQGSKHISVLSKKSCLYCSNLLQRHKNFAKDPLFKPLLPGYKALNSHPWNQRSFGSPSQIFPVGSYISESPPLITFVAICVITYCVISLSCCKLCEEIALLILLSLLPFASPRLRHS